jgi:hypothetical protein
MTDTPQHIKDLQLKIWLSKPPMERLRQFLTDNEALYIFWQNAKKERAKQMEQLDNSLPGGLACE